MPTRSIPSVSGVVPSIQRWIQSSGCAAASSWRFSLTGPSATPCRLGKAAWPARSGPWQPSQPASAMSACPTAGSGSPEGPATGALAPGMANGGFSPARFEAR